MELCTPPLTADLTAPVAAASAHRRPRTARPAPPVDYARLDRGDLDEPLGDPSEKRGRKRAAAIAVAPASAPSPHGAVVAAAAATSRALLVKPPWAGLLCRGEKVWELRSRKTLVRGRVALVASGTGGYVVGGATLVACHGPLSEAQLEAAMGKHRVPATSTVGRYAQTFAWEFADAAELAVPIKYTHPPGAIIWVALPAAVTV